MERDMKTICPVPSASRAIPRAGRLGAAGAALAVCLLTGCKEKTQATSVPQETNRVCVAAAEPMDQGRPEGGLSYLAVVRADKETDLSFKVGGIVDVIGPAAGTDWDEGTPVKAGDVLAELKQNDFTNALISARVRAELAVKTVERFRKLRTTDAISQQELDVSEANWRTSQAQLDEAEQNMKDSRLVASMDGVVLARYVNAHVTVGAGQRALRVADTRTMSVELGLPDRLVTRLSPGNEVDVVVSALEGRPPFRGRVSEVGVSANAEGRLYRVVIKVPNPDGVLRSGMTARIVLGDAPSVRTGLVRIPLSALVTLSPAPAGTNAPSASQLSVFVAQDGKAVQRAVKTGDILGSSILVTEGLQPGEHVVTSGASFLYDGARIEVVPEASRP